MLKKPLPSDSSCCLGLLLLQILSKKVFTLYSLAMQQLSKQDHYDFGLRSLTSLLRYAGRKRRTVNNVPDEEVNKVDHKAVSPAAILVSWSTPTTLLLSNVYVFSLRWF